MPRFLGSSLTFASQRARVRTRLGFVLALGAALGGVPHLSLAQNSCALTPDQAESNRRVLSQSRRAAPPANGQGLQIVSSWMPLPRSAVMNADGWQISGVLTSRFVFTNGNAQLGRIIGANVERSARVTFAYSERSGIFTMNSSDDQSPNGVFSVQTARLVQQNSNAMSDGSASYSSGGKQSTFSFQLAEQYSKSMRVLQAAADGLPVQVDMVMQCALQGERGEPGSRNVASIGYRYRADFDLSIDVTVVRTETSESEGRSVSGSLVNRTSGSVQGSANKVFMLTRDAFVGSAGIRAAGAGLDSLFVLDPNLNGRAAFNLGGNLDLSFRVTGSPIQTFRSYNMRVMK